MKSQLLTLLACAAVISGCNKQQPDPFAAERQRLEAERAAIAQQKADLAEKEIAAQKDAAAAETARAAADSKRVEAERGKLEAEKRALEAEKAKVESDKVAAMSDAEKATRREAAIRVAEEKAAIEAVAAESAAERRKIEMLKAQVEAQRLAAERATAEARVREGAAKRAEADAAAQRTVQVFYEPLGQHGDWLETDRYGFVWRPHRAADKNWRPYVDGRWQPTDYGWTWRSNEPFGWAVYHFGRWARVPREGWIWVPGHEWAPAWVAWRTRGAQYVGWAPLPPEAPGGRAYTGAVDSEFDIGPAGYSFVAVTDLDLESYREKTLPVAESLNVLRSSRNVTSIFYRNGSIYCGGPDPTILQSEIRMVREQPEAQPLARVNLTLVNHPASKSTPEAVDAGGFILFAPKLESGAPATRPKKVREKLLVKDVERGWSDSLPISESEWRGKIKREADALDPSKRPPPPPAVAVVPKPTPPPATPTPAPRAPVATQEVPGKLKPARIQPASPLFSKP